MFFSDNGLIHIEQLYVLPKYQDKGIGTMAFEIVKNYCLTNNYDKFTCNCSEYNKKAQGFYEKMNGKIIAISSNHESKKDDQITYEFVL